MAIKGSIFSADVTKDITPAAPNAQLRAAANELGGKIAAENITAATKVGATAYEGWVEAEAAKRAKAVTDGLNTPELGFVGPVAYTLQGAQQELNKDRGVANNLLAGDVPDATAAEFKARAESITAAVNQGVFTQAQANARLATDMRELIAANPSQAERIRKTYSAYTGRGDWDYKAIEHGLTGKVAEDKANKQLDELFQNDAKKMFDAGIGKQFGLNSSAEIYLALKNRTDVGVAASVAMTANNYIAHANKERTTGSMNEFYNLSTSIASAEVFAKAQPIVQKLRDQGIDILGMSVVRPEHRAAIEDAYQAIFTAEQTSLQGAIEALKQRQRSDPTIDAAAVNDTLEKLTKRLTGTPQLKDAEGMLNVLKMSAAARNQNADTLLKAAQVRDLSLRTTWSEDMIAKMKDPRTREQIVANYPNNPYVKQLAKEFETRQSEFSNEMREYEMIADGLFNAAAPALHKSAAELASTTPEGRAKVAAVTQIAVGNGAAVLDAKIPVPASKLQEVLATATNYTPDSNSFNTVYNSVVSGEYKKSIQGEADQQKFVKAALERSERFLSSTGEHSYPYQLRTALKDIGKFGGGVEATPDGLLAIKRAGPGAMYHYAALGKVVAEANQMLTLHKTLSGDNTRAQRLVNDIRNASDGRDVSGKIGDKSKVEIPASRLVGSTEAEMRETLANLPKEWQDAIIKDMQGKK